MKILPRYRAILVLCATYRILLRETLGRLLLSAACGMPRKELLKRRKQLAGNALTRLAKEGLLQHHHSKSAEYPSFPGGLSYFTLSEKGARLIGASEDRCETAGKHTFDIPALLPHLAMHWFCVMNRWRCHRLEPWEAAKKFGELKSFDIVPHCIVERNPGDYCMYRCYSPSTTITEVVKQVHKLVDKAQRVAPFPAAFAAGQYGIAILLPEVSYCQDLTQALQREQLIPKHPLIVRLGPTPATLSTAIRLYEKDITL
jgi:hypothetical protein